MKKPCNRSTNHVPVHPRTGVNDAGSPRGGSSPTSGVVQQEYPTHGSQPSSTGVRVTSPSTGMIVYVRARGLEQGCNSTYTQRTRVLYNVRSQENRGTLRPALAKDLKCATTYARTETGVPFNVLSQERTGVREHERAAKNARTREQGCDATYTRT